ncbi:hypothetical protein [Vibrio crassostreae]|uniref:hypothetical protein n=1 Tax=Vibrio crassostreae TaxID=246167 RepID=UPI001B30D5D0|nr:hypothetical protein [Vibrio crassostreae]
MDSLNLDGSLVLPIEFPHAVSPQKHGFTHKFHVTPSGLYSLEKKLVNFGHTFDPLSLGGRAVKGSSQAGWVVKLPLKHLLEIKVSNDDVNIRFSHEDDQLHNSFLSRRVLEFHN